MALTTVTKTGLHEIALDHVFTVGASGTDHYTFQGEGLNGTVNDPTLYLTRGKTYRFEKGSAHPLRIQSTTGLSGTAYNTGVTNNGGTGTVIMEVQHDAPDVLYYQCTSHANMNGVLYITGALPDGGVTTAKIATDAVTSAKIASDAVGSAEIANSAVTTIKIADANVTTAKIATGAVTTNKIADNQITSAKIVDTAVTLAKLEHGTSSNDGKFLRANNGADPTFETVDLSSKLSVAGGTMTGTLYAFGGIELGSHDTIKFDSDDQDTNHISFKGPLSLSSTVTYTLPEDGSNGQFLKTNGSGVLSFATVNTDLVSDSSPQLGGDLDLNGHKIEVGDGGDNAGQERIDIGTSGDMKLYHDGTNSVIKNSTNDLYVNCEGDDLFLRAYDDVFIQPNNGSDGIKVIGNGAVQLYYDNSLKLATTGSGVNVTGSISATSFVGSGSGLTGIATIPAGAVIPFAMDAAPSGYLECSGAAVSRSTYSALFAAIGTTYGAGDGSSTFNLPNLRGEFIRGLDNGRGIDSNRAMGSFQDHGIPAMKGHISDAHGQSRLQTFAQSGFTNVFDGVGSSSWRTSIHAVSGQYASIMFDSTNVIPAADHVRPRNVAMMYCIKT